MSFYGDKTAFSIFFSLIPLLYSALYKFKIYKLFVYSFVLYFFSLIWTPNSISMVTESLALQVLISAVMLISIPLILSITFTLPFYIFKLSQFSEFKTAVVFPFIYIFGEWLQGSLGQFSFPWVRLGNIASPFTVFIQSASIFGTLFISLLILYINMCAALLLIRINTQKKIIFSSFSVFLTAINLTFGFYNCNATEKNDSPPLSAVIVQGNYPKNSKRSSSPDQMLKKYLDLLYSDAPENADIILFPETSMHSQIYKTDGLQHLLYKLCSDFNALLLSGSQYNADDKHYNACMTVNTQHEIDAAYIKRKLVPFGEYMPFDVKHLNIVSSSFSAGNECGLIDFKNGQIGCLICFESIFPRIAAENSQRGAQAAAILTNDSWLGEKIPLYQHHSHSIMRAVENNIYFLTSTNTGISSIINRNGKVITQGGLNAECVVTGDFYLSSKKSFYTMYGDIIILPSCVIIIYSCTIYLFNQIKLIIFKST